MMFNTISIDHLLKCIDNRVGTDSAFDRCKAIFFKFGEHLRFRIIMEAINDFISQPDKAINSIYGIANFPSKKEYSQGKTGAVKAGCFPAADSGQGIKSFFHH